MMAFGRAMRSAARRRSLPDRAGVYRRRGPVRADEPIEIFDAHMHYNWEPKPYYGVDEVLALFKKHRVTGILATSRPNTGTHALMDAKPAGLQIVPFIRPYRVRADIQTWFGDPFIFDLVRTNSNAAITAASASSTSRARPPKASGSRRPSISRLPTTSICTPMPMISPSKS